MDYAGKIKKWNDINVGDSESFTKTITETDIILWVGLSGDMNPVHIDKEYAKTTMFGDTIAPGILVAGLLSTVMTKLTLGNVYASQDYKFLKPVYAGDTITAVATVTAKEEEKHRVVIKTQCFNQRDELVITGEGREYIME